MSEREFDLTSWLQPLAAEPAAEHLSAREVRQLGGRRRITRVLAAGVAASLVVAVGSITLLNRPAPPVATPPSASPSASPSAALTSPSSPPSVVSPSPEPTSQSLSSSPTPARTPTAGISTSPQPAPSTRPVASTRPSTSAPSSAPVTPSTTTAPGPMIKAGDRLRMEGLGEVTIGTPLATVAARGVVTKSYCPDWRTSDQLTAQGVRVGVTETEVYRIELSQPTYATQSGAKVGMTVAAVKKIYGAGVKTESVSYMGDPREALTIRSGATMIVFLTNSWTLADADAVTSIVLKKNDAYSVIDDGCA